MKSLRLIWALVLCTACTSAPSLTADATSPREASLPPTATAQPSATLVPSATTFPLPSLPSPRLLLEPLIDNVVVGPQDQLYVSWFASYGDDLRHFAQWDGATWIELGTGFRTAGNSMVGDAAGHLYTEALTDDTQGNAAAIVRWDGQKWEDITGDFSVLVDTLQPGRVSSNVPVTALAVDGLGNLYAAGAFNYLALDQSNEIAMGYVARWNGEAWAVLGTGFDKVNVFALAASAMGDVYASGEQPLTPEGKSGFIAKWDGTGWTQIDTRGPDIILKLALNQTGGLYVAGQQQIGGAFLDYWDRKKWTALASQFQAEAPAIFDVAIDSDGYPCLGGSFESIGGIPASNIACWDGNRWHALGSGVNERVDRIAFDTIGNLYAVGLFTQAGGQPVPHIARWDGQRWLSLSP